MGGNRKIKACYFNTKTEAELLEFVGGLDNFSNWVKNYIKKEIQARETGVSPDLVNMVESLIEVKLAEHTMVPKKETQNKINVADDLDAFFK